MTDKCKTFVARWDHAMCSTCGEEHNRPAPTPTPAPGLDLDAVEEATISDDQLSAWLRELAEAHVEIARLTKALDERDADMHARMLPPARRRFESGPRHDTATTERQGTMTTDNSDDRYTQFYDERGNGPDVIRMDVEPMPTVIERNCHLVFARSEDDDFHATRFVPGGYRLDDRSSQWLMGRLMLWMSGQLVFTGYKDAARNLPGPIDVDGIVASVPDALRVELRDALTAAIDAPRLAARLKPEVVAAAHGYQLLRTSAGEWGTLWQDSEDDPSDDEPAWLADEAAARLDYEDSTGQRRCESCGTYRDSEERSVDEDGIYTCADESACSAACAAKESAK